MKKVLAISGTVLVLAMCSTPPVAGAALTPEYGTGPVTEARDADKLVHWLEANAAKQKEMERIVAEQTERDVRTQQLNNVIEQLKARIGKTPYVFSGSTPSGWDCSGMVMWAYGELDIAIEHRASKQKYSGEFVTEPKVGDIVAFSYNGYESAYHVGIWLGPDTMIHSGGRAGEATEIIPISSYTGSHSYVTYTRLIDTN